MPRLAFVLLLALLAACGDAPDTTAESAEAGAVAEGPPVLESVTAEGLLDEVRASDADLVVVNFWASWCLPCREEFPAFIRLRDEADDVAVHFVSVDYEEDYPFAEEFLAEFDVPRSYVREGKDAPFIEGINPTWTGSLPATAIYDGDGNRLAFWEGVVDYDALVARVAEARQAS